MVGYLEVSARQTGKTSRLVQAATEAHFLHGKTVIIVSPCANVIKELAPFAAIVVKTEEAALEAIQRRRGRIDDYAWFYDEFDFLKGNVSVRPDAYYTTTAAYLRRVYAMTEEEIKEDVLLQLVSIHRRMVITYAHFPTAYRKMAHAAKDFPPGRAETEVEGRFIEYAKKPD